MKKTIEFHFKYKYPILLLVIALSCFGASLAPKLPINLALDKLLPEDSSSVREMNLISDEIGGVGHLSVLIGPVDHPEVELDIIAENLRKLPDIKYLFYKTEQHLLEDKILFLLTDKEFGTLKKNTQILFNKGKKSITNFGLEDEGDRLENLEKAKKYFVDFKKDKEEKEFLLSKDKKFALLMIKPIFESVDLERSEILNRQVANVVASILHDKPFRLLGRYVEKVRDTRQIEGDIQKTGFISIALIILCLVLGLGSLRAAFVVVAGVGMALGLTAGFAYYLVGQINILTGFLMAILAGLGADYGIHLVKRYHQEIEDGHSSELALMHTYRTTGRALFSSAVSTAVAFLCLSISDFRGFSELGIIAGMGILSVLFVFILCLPVLGRCLGKNHLWPKLSESFGFFPFKIKHLKYFLLLFPFIIYGIFHAEFEYDFNRMRGFSKETYSLKILIDELYGKSSSPIGIMAPDQRSADAVVDFIEQEKFKPVIQETVSLSKLLIPRMDSRYRKIKKLNNLVEDVSDEELIEKTGMTPARIRSWLKAEPYALKDLPLHLQTSFGKTGNIILLYPVKQIDNKDDLYELASVLKEIKENFPNVKIGSDTLVFGQIVDHIIEDGKLIILIFLLGIFVAFLIDFRSVKSSLILELQVVLGIIFLLGLMGIFGVRLTIMNVGIFPAILAAGIDMGVHVLHRENEGWRALRSAKLSASAIQVSLATTFIGFGSLLFAEAKILKGIAWLAILGLFAMYLVCMVLRPMVSDYFTSSKKV